MKQEDKDRITAIIIIIIILIIGGLIGDFIQQNFLITHSSKPKTQTNTNFKRIKAILMMPLYYIVEYPKLIMGISNGEIYDYSVEQESTPQKQFVPFSNNK